MHCFIKKTNHNTIYERKGCLYFDSMTIVAIHFSSHLTPTQHSKHLATSTDNLSTFRGEQKTERERERERRPNFSELHYMPFNNHCLRVQQRNYICFIYVGKRTAKTLVCRMHYKGILTNPLQYTMLGNPVREII